MTELLKTYAHMKQEYASVLKFFGEDPITMRVDDFFSTFAGFISDFEVRPTEFGYLDTSFMKGKEHPARNVQK